MYNRGISIVPKHVIARSVQPTVLFDICKTYLGTVTVGSKKGRYSEPPVPGTGRDTENAVLSFPACSLQSPVNLLYTYTLCDGSDFIYALQVYREVTVHISTACSNTGKKM